MDEMLKEASEARKFSISLAHLEYSDDLVSQMKKHSVKLETIYAKVQDLKKRGVKNNARFEKFYAIYDSMSQWYKKAEAINTFGSVSIIALKNPGITQSWLCSLNFRTRPYPNEL